MWIPCVCGGIAGWGCKGSSLVTLSLLERLQDAPRPGVKPKFTTEQRSQMAALACEAPAQAGRPISQWTGREIAEEMQARGIVEQILPRYAARLLKKGAFNPICSGIGQRRYPIRNEKRRSRRNVRSLSRRKHGLKRENGPSALGISGQTCCSVAIACISHLGVCTERGATKTAA
jgi:hypothetical protein